MNTSQRGRASEKIRTVSSNEAKQHWGAMIRAVGEGEAVIVESHGKPKAVVISPESFDELRRTREQQQRDALLKRIEALERRQTERNLDLADEQIAALADRAGNDIFEELAAEGKLAFERDRNR